MNGTDKLTLTQASKIIPGRGGKPVNINTLRRWLTKGCRGVRLKAERCGGQWLTTREWIDRFIAECTEQAMAGMPVAEVGKVHEAHQLAIENLRRLGLYGKEGEVSRVPAKDRRTAARHV